MSDLVARLAQGNHAIQASLRPDRTPAALKECLDRGFVLLRFTETRGGTEVGVRVDAKQTDLTSADFAGGAGQITIVGRLILDYVKAKCIATIELSSLIGVGRLEPEPAE